MKGTSALSVFSTNAIHVQHDSLCVHFRSLEQSGIVLDDSCSEDTLSSNDGESSYVQAQGNNNWSPLLCSALSCFLCLHLWLVGALALLAQYSVAFNFLCASPIFLSTNMQSIWWDQHNLLLMGWMLITILLQVSMTWTLNWFSRWDVWGRWCMVGYHQGYY